MEFIRFSLFSAFKMLYGIKKPIYQCAIVYSGFYLYKIIKEDYFENKILNTSTVVFIRRKENQTNF